MFDINQIYKVENFLDEDQLKGFHIIKNHYVWKFNNTSHDDRKVFWKKDFWGDEFGKCLEIENTFRIKIENTFNIKLQTLEVFMNGQAHGQCGSMHTDVQPDWDDYSDYITVVYYANQYWEPDFGGFTVVVDHLDNIHTIYPKPNDLAIFSSRVMHVGLEPTVNCTRQRETLVLKFKLLKE